MIDVADRLSSVFRSAQLLEAELLQQAEAGVVQHGFGVDA
jgi:hypothetical protein